MQLNKQHRQLLRSLDSGQMEALAQLGRLLGTVVREDKVAEGCMLFWRELLTIHNKEKREKEAELKKQEEQAAAILKPKTWNDLLTDPPRA